MTGMNVLVIGSGGREHALCWALRNSPQVDLLYCAPGNGGIADVAECVSLDVDHHEEVIRFCREKDIGLTVIGPEAPLVDGLANSLADAGHRAFGPSAKAAQLEGSKAYTKNLCAEHNIPTAGFAHFTNGLDAKKYIAEKGTPLVIKADGLAAGKGVIMAETEAQAVEAVDDIFGGKFGEAGAELVIEDWLIGEEASFFALVDGTTAVPLVTAQDHKRVGDGDTGPNTGGMGAYSPAPIMSEDMCAQVMDEIINPTVKAMAERGTPYVGVLYAGLMITETGPQLIEYNVRFGDPECQVLMMRLKSDLLDALVASCEGTLDKITLDWSTDPALTVVMASQGYPGSYKKNTIIKGLRDASKMTDVEIFHAGTARKGGRFEATGGRVLNITASGISVSEAQEKAYQAIEKIDWAEGFCRKDIGWRAIEREKS